MPTRVRFPGGEHGAQFTLKIFEPRWGPEGELPVHMCSYSEGDLRWFGTGTAVAELRDLPISVRLPFSLARGHVVWSKPKADREELTMALRKVSAQASSGTAAGPGLEDRAQWPHLLEYLTETKYPDGSPREPSSLIIVADATGWRGCVSDKDNGRTMWKSATTVEALLLTLEEALASEDPSAWRQSAATKWKGKKKG